MKLTVVVTTACCFVSTYALAEMPTDFVIHPKMPSAKIISPRELELSPPR